MFTIDQVKAAHAKVKSGADFPNYIEELKGLGVESYINYVSDGHTEYSGTNSASGPAKYATKSISPTADKHKLESDLKIHQAGGSDYPTFCSQAAESGIFSWKVDTWAHTCIYFDKSGAEIVKEEF